MNKTSRIFLLLIIYGCLFMTGFVFKPKFHVPASARYISQESFEQSYVLYDDDGTAWWVVNGKRLQLAHPDEAPF